MALSTLIFFNASGFRENVRIGLSRSQLHQVENGWQQVGGDPTYLKR
jgi:hypothetical protein